MVYYRSRSCAYSLTLSLLFTISLGEKKNQESVDKISEGGHMKRLFIFFLLCFLTEGCITTPQPRIHESREYVYKKVLVMPFTEGGGDTRWLIYDEFVKELSKETIFEIYRRERNDEQWVVDLELTHPDSYGPVDFSPEDRGIERRAKIEQMYAVNALIFGSFFKNDQVLSLHVQMVEVENGELILSFSREIPYTEVVLVESIKSLSSKCAEKVLRFLKENWTDIKIKKY